MKSWVVSQTCLQTLPNSWLPALSWSNGTLLVLLVHPPRALSTALTHWKEHGPKHPQQLPPANPNLWSRARPERVRLDPVRSHHHWIIEDMGQPSNPHPHWWREIKASGKVSVGAHAMHREYNDFLAQNYALWQVAAFKLPLAQQEASGWQDALPTLQRLWPQDFSSLCH